MKDESPKLPASRKSPAPQGRRAAGIIALTANVIELREAVQKLIPFLNDPSNKKLLDALDFAHMAVKNARNVK